jgi:hypothetical protein
VCVCCGGVDCASGHGSASGEMAMAAVGKQKSVGGHAVLHASAILYMRSAMRQSRQWLCCNQQAIGKGTAAVSADVGRVAGETRAPRSLRCDRVSQSSSLGQSDAMASAQSSSHALPLACRFAFAFLSLSLRQFHPLQPTGSRMRIAAMPFKRAAPFPRGGARELPFHIPDLQLRSGSA